MNTPLKFKLPTLQQKAVPPNKQLKTESPKISMPKMQLNSNLKNNSKSENSKEKSEQQDITPSQQKPEKIENKQSVQENNDSKQINVEQMDDQKLQIVETKNEMQITQQTTTENDILPVKNKLPYPTLQQTNSQPIQEIYQKHDKLLNQQQQQDQQNLQLKQVNEHCKYEVVNEQFEEIRESEDEIDRNFKRSKELDENEKQQLKNIENTEQLLQQELEINNQNILQLENYQQSHKQIKQFKEVDLSNKQVFQQLNTFNIFKNQPFQADAKNKLKKIFYVNEKQLLFRTDQQLILYDTTTYSVVNSQQRQSLPSNSLNFVFDQNYYQVYAKYLQKTNLITFDTYEIKLQQQFSGKSLKNSQYKQYDNIILILIEQKLHIFNVDMLYFQVLSFEDIKNIENVDSICMYQALEDEMQLLIVQDQQASLIKCNTLTGYQQYSKLSEKQQFLEKIFNGSLVNMNDLLLYNANQLALFNFVTSTKIVLLNNLEINQHNNYITIDKYMLVSEQSGKVTIFQDDINQQKLLNVIQQSDDVGIIQQCSHFNNKLLKLKQLNKYSNTQNRSEQIFNYDNCEEKFDEQVVKKFNMAEKTMEQLDEKQQIHYRNLENKFVQQPELQNI